MLRHTSIRQAARPLFQITPETTPIKVTRSMLGWFDATWWNGIPSNPHEDHDFDDRDWSESWPAKTEGWTKGRRPLLETRYSAAAINEALNMIPPNGFFETSDVPRPPTRIQAQSEGIVGRWYTNYWTLHSMRHQCMLAGIPWRYGEREKPMTNFEQPFLYVDYEESKALRDYRTRWINIHRSMVNMTKRMKDVEDEQRFVEYKRMQDSFWSDRRVLINRVKAMKNSRTITQRDVPIPTMNLRALD